MDKLKENKFWTAIGAAGVVLALLFYVLVMGAWSEYDKYERTLQTVIPQDIPGNPDIEAWKQRKQKLQENYNAIVDFYSDLDRELEKWLPGLTDPDSARFTTRYDDARNRLEEQLKAAGIAVGIEGADDFDFTEEEGPKFGFNWEKMTPDIWSAIGPNDAPAVVKTLQKRFWVRRRIKEVALAIKDDQGRPSVRRIRDVRFLTPLHKNYQQSLTAGKGVILPYPGTGEAAAGRQAFQEWTLPNDLGETMTFGFTLDMMYGDLPAFTREFLRLELEPKMLLEIVGLRTYVLRDLQNPLVKEIPWKEKQEDPDRKKKEFEQSVQPVPVTVQFTCRVIDFDPEKAKAEPKPAGP